MQLEMGRMEGEGIAVAMVPEDDYNRPGEK
jgi:hypothetical protein